MAIKSATIGNGKNHFSRKWQSNQERMETKKKTFVPDVSQITNEWKRKKKFCASWQYNQQWMETEKTENEAMCSQMSNKMRLRMLEMSSL